MNKILSKGEIEDIVDTQERNFIVSFAENFFKRTNEEKHRRQDELSSLTYRLETEATEKLLKIVNPFVQEQNGIYDINFFINGIDKEVEFSSKSIEEIFRKWSSCVPSKRKGCRITVVANGRKLVLYYFYIIIGKYVDDFFGKRHKRLHEELIELDEWWLHKRNGG